MNTSFWKSGHTPTLLSAFLYFDLSFMVWYVLGPLGVQIAADLGLTFYTAQSFPDKYQGGVFSAQHGSWNRTPRNGYEVIFVPFVNGVPAGPPEDVLTGFLNNADQAMGRPVGVQFDGRGALLVADDVGDVIWRVTPA